MLVLGVHAGDLGHELGVEVGVVGDLALVNRLVEAALDLLLGEAGGGDHDVVAGIARDQLGVQGFVVLEGVVVDLDAVLLLEVGHQGFGDVVGPVVDVEDLLVVQHRAGRHRRSGRGSSHRSRLGRSGHGLFLLAARRQQDR
ncbi:hypothetical protein D9M68_726150 [compost metagenome]